MRFFPSVIAFLLIFTSINITASASESFEADSVFMQAVITAEDGDYEQAAAMLESIKGSVQDPYLYEKLSEYYINLQKYESARQALMDGLALFPDSAPLNFALAQMYLYHYRDLGMAEIFVKDALKAEENSKYLYTLADIYKLAGDSYSLMRTLNRLIELEKDPKAYVERGDIYKSLGLLGEAVSDYKHAFENSSDLSAAARLAEIYIMQEKYDEAIPYLTFLAENSGDFVLPEMKLAEIYTLTDRKDKALEIFKGILPKLEGKEKAYVLRQIAGIYYAADDFDNALIYFSQLAEITPDDIKIFYSLGVINEMKGNYTEAVKMYRKALDLRSDYVEARKRIGYIMLREKKYDEGLKVLLKIPAELRDVTYYRVAGALYKGKKQLDKAYAVLREGYEENPSSVDLVIDFAVLLDDQKKYDECFEVLKSSLELNPEDPSLMNFLGFMYADLNMNLDEAYSLIEKALAEEPENPAFLDSMAWVLYRFEKYEEAYGYQVRALKGSPDEEEIRGHMKAILERLDINKSVDDILKGK